MNIALVSFKDIDCSEAITELLETVEDEDVSVFLPIIKPLPEFFKGVIKSVTEYKENNTHKITLKFFFASAEGYDQYLKYGDDLVVAESPIKEMLRNLTPDDALGIVWDDSSQAHYVIHAVEDLALEVWDITDELMPIEDDVFGYDLDSEVLHEDLLQAMGKFVDLLAAFVASTVMESLGEAVAQHLLMSADEMDKKDFNPFDDLE